MRTKTSISLLAAAGAIALFAAPAQAGTSVHVQIGAPGYVYAQPGYVYSQPGYVYGQPGYGYGQPAYVYGQPAYVYTRPGYGPRPQHHGVRGRDRDRDGVPDRFDRDRDGDGVPNRWDRRPDNPRRY